MENYNALYSPNQTSLKVSSTISTLIWEYDNGGKIEIGVDRKFNWFQRFMLKFCFGFKVRRNK